MKNLELTTICYIEHNNKYLMLHRIKKQYDINKDKWIGIGGHLEDGESPEECVVRETLEETGLSLNSYNLRGIITFVSNVYNPVYMFLFTADNFSGELINCDEGNLEWIDKGKVYDLPIWEGDKVFLRLLDTEAKFFSLKLVYEGEILKECYLDGKEFDYKSILVNR